MSFFKLPLVLVLGLVLLSGCKGMQEDLSPSGQDKRTATSNVTDTTTTTSTVDFTVYDTQGQPVSLSQALGGKRGVVLYFTMWCPVCATHTEHLVHQVMPLYPNFGYYLVDYVSGDFTAAARAQQDAGYGNASFGVLADGNKQMVNLLNATMGTTVVINPQNEVVFNEDFKDGTRLAETLKGL
ncbi:MAG: hypothetical protein A2600_05055 [Candidatus Lambdaproteobacteria bacterium RIFOXYD1_FULL_56_27]|uniref:Thioredoxin domain-containing protein n=1 Tax=Candidatus Lambdaproteobacteria bacterium RIFOXYD2_FULL_56_26 TaxID=1817773 RepID=A0A1F6GRT9_9PROT|nr:MAG: hypothetical protein A2426_07910 [Candidatus Lambdaproteobacteria bacterium RIFOXYC1_FULL_56_13]OGH00814.1 MAG: hypothetical protein A2557_03830 [Candidatus Lambdaproteobacteria bacterium RIFOXYD2_FULL_56_26]OGH09921.1 MAG: hypothetical protein A2600_05055 [Candidatus Lambdaproteobacteria bacterium RIFOXYD1_FULL_56_27]